MRFNIRLKLVSAVVFLVVVFSISIVLIRSRMNEKTTEIMLEVVRTNSLGYTRYLENTFQYFSELLIKFDTDKSLEVEDLNTDIYLSHILKYNATIVGLAIFEPEIGVSVKYGAVNKLDTMIGLLDNQDSIISTQVLDNNFLVYCYNSPARKDVKLYLFIDLQLMHERFVSENLFISAYQIVINQEGRCVYHPQESYIGQIYKLSDFIYEDGHIKEDNFNKIEYAQSNFLGMLAYRNYSVINVGEQDWIVINVTPGFEIKELIDGQQSLILLVFVVFVSLISGVFLYSYVNWKSQYKQRMVLERKNLNLKLFQAKQKNETVAIKLEILKTGLNSHFLFNSLSLLKAMLNPKEVIIKRAFTKLSNLYRYQLYIEGESKVFLREEVEFVTNYIDIINLRLENALQVHFHNIESYGHYQILPIALQTLVENCVKHNIASKDTPLIIHIKVEGEMLYVTNQYNPKQTLITTSGKGLVNLKTRYGLLTNKKCFFDIKGGFYVASIPLFVSE